MALPAFVEVLAAMVQALVALPYFYVKWVLWYFRTWWVLRKAPGPRGNLLLGHALEMQDVRQPKPFVSHKDDERVKAEARRALEASPMYHWGNTYHPLFLVWLGPTRPLFIVNGPAAARDVLGNKGPLRKAALYNFLHPWLGTGLLTSTGDKWRTRRHMITPSFHFEILRAYFEVFTGRTRDLLGYLDKEADGGKPFHIYRYMTHVALDIITECATGEAAGALRDGNTAYVRSVYAQLELVFERIMNPLLWPEVWYTRCTRSGARSRQGLRILHAHTDAMVAKRRMQLFGEAGVPKEDTTAAAPAGSSSSGGGGGAASSAGPSRERSQSMPTGCATFLDVLLTAKTDDGKPLTADDIREEVDTFIFEGHDTTSAGMTWFLYLIGCHPKAQARIHEELDEVIGDREVVTMDDLGKLVYLEAAITEALRMVGPVPFIGRIMEEDTVIAGVTIPAGVEILVPPLAMHHTGANWVDDHLFRPERFLAEGYHGQDAGETATGGIAAAPKKGGKHPPFSYVPFSAGPRGCIGRTFAIMEEKVVLSAMLKRYRVLTPPDQEVVPSMEIITKPRDGQLLLKLTRR